MALSSVTYSGDGSTTQFSVPFQYLFPTDVNATVNGTTTAFTFVNPGLAAFSPAPAAASVIIIKRTTTITSLDVEFSDGSTVQASDINSAELQALYLLQEAQDAVAAETTRAEAAESSASSAVTAETGRAEAAEAALTALINSVVGFLNVPGAGTFSAFFTAFFSTLPTTLPGTAGHLWNNGGVVSIS